MPYPYITQVDLEQRVSAAVLRDICDDDNDGASDPGAVERVLKDASAKVAGYLRESYDLASVAANTPEEVKRLALDLAVVYLRQRHPEVVRGDWRELLAAANRDLMNIRTGNTRLDVVGSPEPHQNIGRARVTSTPTRGWSDDEDERCF